MPDARAVLSSAPAGIVTPGQRIAQAVGFQAGQGCYIAPDGCIYASVVGLKRELPVVVAAAEGSATPEMEADGRNVVEVSMLTEPTMQPTLGDLVTARVTKINPRYASLEILCVEGRALHATFPGVVRSQDVRLTEIDKVEIYRCFRPGDVVAAEVLSMGDARSYYLTTAKNELGVTHATSANGSTLVPLSWEEMTDPNTREREPRKVAKPKAAQAAMNV